MGQRASAGTIRGSPCSAGPFLGKYCAEPTRSWVRPRPTWPQCLHPASELLSRLPPAGPGQTSAPGTVWAGLNRPGSEARSPVALARGRNAALYTEGTKSQHCMVCSHARASSSHSHDKRRCTPKLPWDSAPLTWFPSVSLKAQGRVLLEESKGHGQPKGVRGRTGPQGHPEA